MLEAMDDGDCVACVMKQDALDFIMATVRISVDDHVIVLLLFSKITSCQCVIILIIRTKRDNNGI